MNMKARNGRMRQKSIPGPVIGRWLKRYFARHTAKDPYPITEEMLERMVEYGKGLPDPVVPEDDSL